MAKRPGWEGLWVNHVSTSFLGADIVGVSSKVIFSLDCSDGAWEGRVGIGSFVVFLAKARVLGAPI